jgi:outer membrane protein assembly factor BamB
MRSMIITSVLATTILLSSCSLSNSQGGADGGGSGDGGFHVDCEPTVTARVKWTYAEGSAAGGPAVGANGTVVLSDTQDLFAIDGTNGSLKWIAQDAKVMIRPAVGSDGTVYATSFSRDAYAFSADTGSVKWKAKMDEVVLATPVLLGDNMVVFSGVGNLLALNVADGAELWRYVSGTGGHYAVPGKDGRLFLIKEGKLVKLGGNGVEEAVFDLPAEGRYPVSGDNGRVFVPCTDKKVYAVSPDDGSVLWTYDAGGDPDAVIAAPGGLLYIMFSGSRLLEAIEQQSGEKRWAYNGEGGVVAPAAGSDGTAYLPVKDVGLVALDPSNGAVRWSYKPSGDMTSQPAVGPDGTVLLPSSGLLTALDPSDKAVPPDKLICSPCSLSCGENNAIRMCQPDGSEKRDVHQCPAEQVCRDANCHECQTHSGSVCYEGKAWWTNSCGNREEVKETCKTGYTCSGGACKKQESCKMTCSADDESISAGLSCGSGSTTCQISRDSHGRATYISCTYSNGKKYYCSISYNSLGQPGGSCNGEGQTCYF